MFERSRPRGYALLPREPVVADGRSSACSACALVQVCWPVGLSAIELTKLDRLIKRSRSLRRGEHVYRAGEPVAGAVYSIRSGSLKVSAPTTDGRSEVTNFLLPGDLLGLDVLDESNHRGDAQALESTSLCEIPLDALDALTNSIVGLRRQLLRVMSRQLQHEQAMLALLRRTRAEQRVASFFLHLSARYERRGFSPTAFRLSMSRQDIGSYLGLTKETVCRVCTRLHESGVIAIDRRQVHLLDAAALTSLARIDP